MQRRIFARVLIVSTIVVVLGSSLLSGCAPKRLAPLEPGVTPSSAEESFSVPTLLDVGLIEGQESLIVSINSTGVLLDSQSRKRLSKIGAQGGSVSFHRKGQQVQWSLQGKQGVAAGVVLQPMDPNSRVTHGDQDYRGDFLIFPSIEKSGLTLVNQVDLESYLCGVVPWEIGRHGEEELAAQAAQAVAARTYTISHLGSRRKFGFDVYASVMDQVYKGSRHEDVLCNQAILETAGMVLAHKGELVDAYYSACCGGTSSKIQEVWPRQGIGYLVDKDDVPHSGAAPFCSDYKYFNWSESWTATELQEILQTSLPAYVDYMTEMNRAIWARPIFTPGQSGADPHFPGAVHDLEILENTPSGRIAHLLITCEAGTYHIRGDRVRWVLAPEANKPGILRSARFELEKVRREGSLVQVSVRGRGYGHGIGLCQVGALEMSRKGYSASKILSHYYPGSILKPLKKP